MPYPSQATSSFTLDQVVHGAYYGVLSHDSQEQCGVKGGEEMRDLVFAMELRGSAAPVAGREGMLRAQTAGRVPWTRR